MELSIDWRRTLNIVGVMALVAVVLPFVVFAVPQVVGAQQSYVVLSSSMSPTYEAGDAIVVNDVAPENIEEGDVITFQAPSKWSGQSGETDLVTHRVVEVVNEEGERSFRTKGDANEESDKQLVPASNVVGQVSFGIPYIGYATKFGGGTTMQLALIIVPAVLLVVNEIWTLANAARASTDDATDSSVSEE